MEEQAVNVEVPGTKLSRAKRPATRELSGRDTRHFWGEVVSEPTRLLITMRMRMSQP